MPAVSLEHRLGVTVGLHATGSDPNDAVRWTEEILAVVHQLHDRASGVTELRYTLPHPFEEAAAERSRKRVEQQQLGLRQTHGCGQCQLGPNYTGQMLELDAGRAGQPGDFEHP